MLDWKARSDSFFVVYNDLYHTVMRGSVVDHLTTAMPQSDFPGHCLSNVKPTFWLLWCTIVFKSRIIKLKENRYLCFTKRIFNNSMVCLFCWNNYYNFWNDTKSTINRDTFFIVNVFNTHLRSLPSNMYWKYYGRWL